MSGTLFRPPPPDGGLTPRQELAYRLVSARPRLAEEVGQWLHLWFRPGRCSCSTDRNCSWSYETGKDVLRSLRRRGLVVRRRSGSWETPRGYERNRQRDVIPY